MNYKLDVKDHELRAKLGTDVVLETAATGPKPNATAVAADVKARTGITVVARVDEDTKTVSVKRLLVG